ncbi:hypothetical protein ACQ4M4_15360 [Leptolyngbya sp. AN02str]|uniref:hypothetical protein n=1 Tax=Leptolyngbya sp. AN02str TaxID=3423363 RepID=UPI003D3167C2
MIQLTRVIIASGSLVVMGASMGAIATYAQEADPVQDPAALLQEGAEERSGFEDFQRLFPPDDEGGGGGDTVDLNEVSENINSRTANERPAAAAINYETLILRPNTEVGETENQLRISVP